MVSKYIALFAWLLIASTGCETKTSKIETKPDRPDLAVSSYPLETSPPPPDKAEFVGGSECSSCHQQEHGQWEGSHHDLAKQEATDKTVLGDFGGAELKYFKEVARFVRKDSKFLIEVTYPDKKITAYEVVSTFGVYPLQQYLVKAPRGRLQASSYLWDARAKEEGGQRWYHLYPDEYVGRDDPLHWTGLLHNWNSNCANCHSTDVHKNYDFKTDTYNTTAAAEDVSCESCHGPASLHVTAAKNNTLKAPNTFIDNHRQPQGRTWVRGANDRIAKLEGSTASVDATCAPCHSRRVDLGIGETEMHQRYKLALLEDRIYFADGQIKDEVFVYGSFLQSRMHQAGVTCVDCHNPHTLELKADGDALCATCHNPMAFGPKHTLHAAKEGVTCVDCHMPKTTYMGVDNRGDHRFGVPRPLQSSQLGSPDACTGCHSQKDAAWAQAAIDKAGLTPSKSILFGETLALARGGQPKSLSALAKLIESDAPDVIKGTAAYTLPAAQPSFDALQNVPKTASPLVLDGLLESAGGFSAAMRNQLVTPRLLDPNLTVRLAAVSVLLGDPPQLDPVTHQAFTKALAEFEASHKTNMDRPESLMALALAQTTRGDIAGAIQGLQITVDRHPWFTQGWINLADLARAQGDEGLALSTLESGLRAAADKPPVHHALGLALIRQRRGADALKHLKAAHEARKGDVRFGYVYAIATHDLGDRDGAVKILDAMLEKLPEHPQLTTLRSKYRQN